MTATVNDSSTDGSPISQTRNRDGKNEKITEIMWTVLRDTIFSENRITRTVPVIR